MSNAETASPLPHGSSAAFPLETLMAGGGSPELSGLVVTPDGRIAIANAGHGLAVRLSPEDAAGLAMLLWGLVPHLAAARDAALDAADAALARIVSERAPRDA